jgi:hypothetical protein
LLSRNQAALFQQGFSHTVHEEFGQWLGGFVELAGG